MKKRITVEVIVEDWQDEPEEWTPRDFVNYLTDAPGAGLPFTITHRPVLIDVEDLIDENVV